jgi:hypothetical protein
MGDPAVEILPSSGWYFGQNADSIWEKFFNSLRLNHLEGLHKSLFKVRQTAVKADLFSSRKALSHRVFHRVCGDRQKR